MAEKMDRFTKRARRILKIAEEEAQRLNHNYIGTEHLLLGLVIEERCLAAKVLRELNVDWAKIRARVKSTIGRGTHQSHDKPLVAPRTKRVIEFATYLAGQMGHIYIGTEHLLIAMLEEGEGIGAEILKEYVTPDEVVEQIVKNIIQMVRSSPRRSVSDEEQIERVRNALTDVDLEQKWSFSSTLTDILKLRRQRMVEQFGQAAAQEERNRLARDLHDSIKQQLFSISASAAAVQAHWQSDPEGAQQALADVQQNARAAIVEMDAMLQQLSPTPLATAGLIEALQQQSEALEYRTGAKVVTAFGQLSDSERLPSGTQEAIFRMAQEVFSNVARHARAANIRVTLEEFDDANALVFEVHDDGQGFNSSQIEQGMGLTNLAARAEELGGKVEISSKKGRGTAVRVEIPLLKASEE